MAIEKAGEPIRFYGSELSENWQKAQEQKAQRIEAQKAEKEYVKLVNNSGTPFKPALLYDCAGSFPAEVLGLCVDAKKGEFISRFQIVWLLTSRTFQAMCQEGKLSIFSKAGRIIFVRRESWLQGEMRLTFEQGEIARLEKPVEDDLVKNGIALQLNVVRDFE